METKQTTETKTTEVSKCACVCHKMLGAFIVAAGILGLLGVLHVMSLRAAGIACSVLAILAGLQTMMRSKCKCCSAA